MSVCVLNGPIQINQVRNNSIVLQGKNVADSWSYILKANNSLSQIAGNLNVFNVVSNIVFDPDVLDNNMPLAGAISPTSGNLAEVV